MQLISLLSDQITALNAQVDSELREELLGALEMARRRNWRNTVIDVWRPLEGTDGVLGWIARHEGHTLQGDNAASHMEELRNYLPAEIASDFHALRHLRNSAGHSKKVLPFTEREAALAFLHVLRILEWYYCVYSNGPHLPTIYAARTAGPVPEENPLFKDRVDELEALRQALAEKKTRLVLVSGPGGQGKTSLLTHLIHQLQVNPILQAATGASLECILYLPIQQPEYRSPDKIVELLCRVLNPEEAEALRARWKESIALSDKLDYLFHRTLRGHPVLIVLDNLEDVLDDANRIQEMFLDLREFIEGCLEGQDHHARIVATSRKTLMLSSPQKEGRLGARKVELPLDSGLPPGEAVRLLRELEGDRDLGIKNISRETLREVVQRCRCNPRTLEQLVGTLSPMRKLPQLLEDAEAFARLVEAPARELYARLSAEEQRVMQALAVYDRPVPAAAVRHLLPEGEVEGLLESLLRKYALHFDLGGFALHRLDQQHAYRQIPQTDTPEGLSALHTRAADYFRAQSKPCEAWETGADVEPALQEFDHLLRAGKATEAADLMDTLDPYLMSWGQYRQVQQLRAQLGQRLTGGPRAYNDAQLAECLYQGLDLWDEAMDVAQQVVDSFADHQNESALAQAVQLQAHIHFERGEFVEAVALADENRKRYERLGQPLYVANVYNSLGIFEDTYDRHEDAEIYYTEAFRLFTEQAQFWEAQGERRKARACQEEAGRVLLNQSVCVFFLRGAQEALEMCRQGLELCPNAERPQEFAYGSLNRAIFHLAEAAQKEAQAALEECAPWAEQELWFRLNFEQVQATLHRLNHRYKEAESLLIKVLKQFEEKDLDMWGDIDSLINLGCTLMDAGKKPEAIDRWKEALRRAQERDYPFAIRMCAYLLDSHKVPDALPPDAQEESRVFQQAYLPRFRVLFAPGRVLTLQSKPVVP